MKKDMKSKKENMIDSEFEILITNKNRYGDLYARLVECEEMFNNLKEFVLNCDKATTNLFNEIFGYNPDNLDVNKNPVFYLKKVLPNMNQIVKENKYYQIDYHLNDFELYLTRFLVGSYVLSETIFPSLDNYFTQILSITKKRVNDFAYYLTFDRGIRNSSNGIFPSIKWELIKHKNEVVTEKNANDKFITLRTQVIAFNYLFKGFDKFDFSQRDITAKAKFIEFLIGKTPSKKIENSNTYKFLKNPLNLSNTVTLNILKNVKKQFEDLQLLEIVERIDRDIKSCQTPIKATNTRE